MTAATAVREILIGLPDLTALVGQRIYNVRAEQNAIRPYIVIHKIDNRYGGHLRGADGLFHDQVQIDTISTTQAEADAITDLVRGDGAGSGLAFWTGSVPVSPPFVIDVIRPDIEGSDTFEADEQMVYRHRADYFVDHR